MNTCFFLVGVACHTHGGLAAFDQWEISKLSFNRATGCALLEGFFTQLRNPV